MATIAPPGVRAALRLRLVAPAFPRAASWFSHEFPAEDPEGLARALLSHNGAGACTLFTQGAPGSDGEPVWNALCVVPVDMMAAEVLTWAERVWPLVLEFSHLGGV